MTGWDEPKGSEGAGRSDCQAFLRHLSVILVNQGDHHEWRVTIVMPIL